jgi:ArsR family transcriptional regulator, lead/cadmium/zinc/bismuth-responsive transcriptional repressor
LPVDFESRLFYNKTYEHILSCYFQSAAAMTRTILDEHTGAHVAELFRAFSDTSRVRIMSALLDGEKNVSALAALVGISESAVSHHMRGLRQTRIVTARRDGKEVYYSITDPHIVTLFKQGVEHVRDD